jgi:hypothetical protein
MMERVAKERGEVETKGSEGLRVTGKKKRQL